MNTKSAARPAAAAGRARARAQAQAQTQGPTQGPTPGPTEPQEGPAMEFYRSSAPGIALTKALNDMLEAGELTLEAAQFILAEFDAVFLQSLREHVVPQESLGCMQLGGTLESYSNIDAFWKIDASDVVATVGDAELKLGRVRLLFMT
jgi:hypothetical protein